MPMIQADAGRRLELLARRSIIFGDFVALLGHQWTLVAKHRRTGKTQPNVYTVRRLVKTIGKILAGLRLRREPKLIVNTAKTTLILKDALLLVSP